MSDKTFHIEQERAVRTNLRETISLVFWQIRQMALGFVLKNFLQLYKYWKFYVNFKLKHKKTIRN